jgi:hypothetical protein
VTKTGGILRLSNMTCCHAPSPRREHFAFPWRGGYSCFGGIFPSDSCLSCGAANFAFGIWKELLFTLVNLLLPWDGAMCIRHGANKEYSQ